MRSALPELETNAKTRVLLPMKVLQSEMERERGREREGERERVEGEIASAAPLCKKGISRDSNVARANDNLTPLPLGHADCRRGSRPSR